MSPKQKKLAGKAPPPNKLDEKDFAVLRAEKAKGRGMGLQDEKVKPGKVQKAALGMLALGMMGKKYLDKKKSSSSAPMMGAAAELMKKKKEILGKRMGGVMKYKRGMGPGGLDLPVISSVKPAVHKTKKAQKTAVMKEQFNKQKSRLGKNPNMTPSSPRAGEKFLKRRKELSGVGKALAATRVGKMLLPVAAAGVATQQYLKSKMKKKDVTKKMGGGMMQRPMGYKEGMGPKLGEPRTEKKRKAGLGALGGAPGKKEKPIIIITKAGVVGKYTKPKIDEKKGRHLRQHKSYDASPRLISEAKGKTFSLRSMNAGGMTKPMGYKYGTSVKAKCKLGRNKPTKIT